VPTARYKFRVAHLCHWWCQQHGTSFVWPICVTGGANSTVQAKVTLYLPADLSLSFNLAS